MKKWMMVGLFGLAGVGMVGAEAVNLACGAAVSGTKGRNWDSKPMATVVDGVVSDQSRWIAGAEVGERVWLELAFETPLKKIAVVDLYSGWKMGYTLTDFDVSYKVGDVWIAPESGKVRGNVRYDLRLNMKAENVSALRVEFEKLNSSLSIREVAIYDDAAAAMRSGLEVEDPAEVISRDEHQIGLNQIGYIASRPKRFTAPLSADGSAFVIREQGGQDALFRGEVKGNIGDFSAFNPKNSAARYVIELSGGGLKAKVSHPFLISEQLAEEHYWQPVVDFLIDSRSVVGTHASAYGGCPWRDGTYYSTIIPALAVFYSANPELVEAMPKQIDWQADQARISADGFKLASKDKMDEGVVYTAKSYYRLEPPKEGAPDVAKLIHWGAGWYLCNPMTHDPSRDPLPRQIHSQTVEQVAYVLWAWPMLKQWLPQSFYDQCYDLCFSNWKNSLAVSKEWDPKTYVSVEAVYAGGRGVLRRPYKGRHAPGHSIVPNLILHEVAKRHGREDAQIYLDAAVKQAEWIVKTLDWNDPRTTKGNRMSEHKTIPSLVWLLQNYPDAAPAGLKEKITEWAEVAVSRSHNLWDFRRYDLDGEWTIPLMNDLGNSICLPGILLSASWVVEDENVRARLEELAMASMDHVFGRNPRLAAAPSDPKNGFPEVDVGWPRIFPHNRCARLDMCRGNLASLPGAEMYPFNPEGAFRHEEGWVHYGAGWCLSLAYLKLDNGPKAMPQPIER